MRRAAQLIRPAAVAFLVMLTLTALASAAGARRPQTDPPERTPGPVRFMLEVKALEPDGAHVLLDGGTFDTQAQAVAEVERITRDGVCVPPQDPGDPGLAATCYPPARHLRTRLLKVWL